MSSDAAAPNKEARVKIYVEHQMHATATQDAHRHVQLCGAAQHSIAQHSTQAFLAASLALITMSVAYAPIFTPLLASVG